MSHTLLNYILTNKADSSERFNFAAGKENKSIVSSTNNCTMHTFYQNIKFH